MKNELDKETSPYLLQHADNPVHWQAWGHAALARAKADDKPILLSVGYAACHWCHVMAHESFEDPATAEVMNRHFVNIKVDREERPDLDTIYQTALALLGEHGGWPLTMFLTPEGTPFWGGTYFPPEPRYGRPGFRDLLARVADIYRKDNDKVAKNAAAMKDALGRLAVAEPGALIPRQVADRVAERLLTEFDSTYGGIGAAPKFPHVPIFELMFNAWRRTGDVRFHDAVVGSLVKMSQGGIYDHLGGGFARYSTDAQWLVPHFEKMLYDNAQLIRILQLCVNASADRLLAERIEETVEWVLREMIAEGGGFAATLDADSEGEEGRFYVWTEAEVDKVLGDESRTFKRVYGVSAAGNWEGKCILNRIATPERLDDETEARLARARARLLAARGARVRPGWDDKVLADWNGLMIAALAQSAAAFDRGDWLAAAIAAFDFVVARMTVPGTRRLVHAFRAGRQGAAATLDDYAAMAQAALVLHEITGESGFLDHARGWFEVLDAHFHDSRDGGYFLTANDAGDVIVRARNAHDGATPSGNGVLASALGRAWLITGETALRDRAEEIIRAFSGAIEKNVFPLATLINAGDMLEHGVQVVIVGARDEAETRALITAAYRSPQADLVMQVVAPGAALARDHPAMGKSRVGDRATAYVCVGPVCSLPFTDPEELTDALARA